MTNILKSILAINPKAEFTISAEDVKQIVWNENTTPISEKDILAKQKELQAEYDAKEYQRKRVSEYPPIGDQLDALYHGGVFPKEMADLIKSVKDKYPKG
tara:strand:- start:459 stop:758 length:300 start_codon:yes stop_codon:yes gene_type:complete